MARWRFRVVYLILLPAIAVAAGILGYYTWQTAGQLARLGEQTILESTLLLVREKVDRVEQKIIAADNAVFNLIDLADPTSIETAWPSVARQISPSVRAVLVLDDSGNPIAYALRGNAEDRRTFLKLFQERILPDLELERQRPNRLKHLHRSYAGTSYLVSYKALVYGGRRQYVALHHDTGYILREDFPVLFASDDAKTVYNVVDENNRRVYGPTLANAGDYLVGHRFPTTLYGWRLQVAPKQAPLLDAKSRTQRVSEVGLIATALVIIVLGIAFVVYAADKERRLNALKSEFIANVSHELKTPLSVIRMFGEMLLTRRVQNEQKEQQYLEIICRESERLSGLIDNVLDFAAVERGKQKYEMRERDLVEVVSRAIETFRYRIEREGLEVALEAEGSVPRVVVDEEAIVLAVINLLDNAVKYGGGTPIDVSVEAHAREVQVRVRDRGPGIAVEDQKRVFERFYRTRKTPAARGSGIGLALVKHIAEAHGGRAWAENATDGGAIVGLALPTKTTASTAPEQPQARRGNVAADVG